MWDSRIKNLGSILLTKGIFAKCLERVIERRGRLFDAWGIQGSNLGPKTGYPN
jgi:hypothetical protein